MMTKHIGRFSNGATCELHVEYFQNPTFVFFGDLDWWPPTNLAKIDEIEAEYLAWRAGVFQHAANVSGESIYQSEVSSLPNDYYPRPTHS